MDVVGTLDPLGLAPGPRAASRGGPASAGVSSAKVVVGGIVPDEDARELRELGVAAVYTPKDYSLAAIMDDLLDLIESSS